MKSTKKLTANQSRVLLLRAKGYKFREIANMEELSMAAVYSRMVKVYCKLGAWNTVDAFRVALLEGILTVEDLRKDEF